VLYTCIILWYKLLSSSNKNDYYISNMCDNELFCVRYTGCFTTCGHYCRRWFPTSLWSRKFIETCVWFWTVTELWEYFNSRTCPRVNCVLRNQLAGDILNLVAYCLCPLQCATRAVYNRAAPCVAASGGIFKNQL